MSNNYEKPGPELPGVDQFAVEILPIEILPIEFDSSFPDAPHSQEVLSQEVLSQGVSPQARSSPISSLQEGSSRAGTRAVFESRLSGGSFLGGAASQPFPEGSGTPNSQQFGSPSFGTTPFPGAPAMSPAPMSSAPMSSSPMSSSHDRFDPFGAVDPLLVTDCSAMLARLYSFLDGELTDARRTKIQHHLDACPSCFSRFDFEAELRIVIAKKIVTQVPDSLAERIRRSICSSSEGV
jgi:mycothiol system anti-sigma-R factor